MYKNNFPLGILTKHLFSNPLFQNILYVTAYFMMVMYNVHLFYALILTKIQIVGLIFQIAQTNTLKLENINVKIRKMEKILSIKFVLQSYNYWGQNHQKLNKITIVPVDVTTRQQRAMAPDLVPMLTRSKVHVWCELCQNRFSISDDRASIDIQTKCVLAIYSRLVVLRIGT